MYHEHFGLREPPFELCTDPRFLFLSPAHSRARAYLDYAVYKGDGLVVISGEIGVGKSMLVHDITEREHKHADVIAIRQPQPDTIGFLQALLLHCGHHHPPHSRPELVAAVQRELAQRFMWGRRTTLIVDEAQKLEREVLEDLRMLADRQVGVDKPLAIVLVGQPCLRERLAGADMEQFRQRVRLSYHLTGMDVGETGAYIHKRLCVAGARNMPQSIVRDHAVARIHRFTGGIPRLINVLTDLALTAAYLDGVKVVTTRQVDGAIEELGWVPYRARRRKTQLAMPGSGLAARARKRWHHGLGVARQAATTGVSRLRKGATMLRSRAEPVTRRALDWLRHRALGDLRRYARLTLARGRQALIDLRPSMAPRLDRLLALARDKAVPITTVARSTLVFLLGAMVASVLISGSDEPADEARLAATPGPFDAQPAVVEATAVVDPAMPANGRTDFLLPAMTPPEVGTPPATPASLPLGASALAYLNAFAPTASNVTDTVARTDVDGLPGIADASWLLSQQPDTYVIQVLAARKRGVVERFLAGRGGDLDLAYYRRMRDEQQWYVLVSGVYADYASAKLASDTLPDEVRKTRPWIRRLAKVQDDIRAANRKALALAAL